MGKSLYAVIAMTSHAWLGCFAVCVHSSHSQVFMQFVLSDFLLKLVEQIILKVTLQSKLSTSIITKICKAKYFQKTISGIPNNNVIPIGLYKRITILDE